MVFSSMVFLWIFLPVSLAGGFVFQKISLQNLFLLLMSLLFYAWGEPHYLILLLLSIGMNWAFGLWMEKAPFHKKFVLVLSVLCNLALLGYYKYADFILNTLDAFLPGADLPRLHLPLPIGISFFTFQAMSYVIDLYRGEYRAEKSLLDLALYISFFPQLIAGPIVKYRDIHEEIHNRQTVSLANLSTGARRFIYGLGKKVILSNLIASCATNFLSADQTQTSSLMAWTVLFSMRCRSIMISPATRIWRSVSEECSVFISWRISICPISPARFRSSGAGGTCLCPVGSRSISIFRLAETAKESCAPASIF